MEIIILLVGLVILAGLLGLLLAKTDQLLETQKSNHQELLYMSKKHFLVYEKNLHPIMLDGVGIEISLDEKLKRKLVSTGRKVQITRQAFVRLPGQYKVYLPDGLVELDPEGKTFYISWDTSDPRHILLVR